jgi:hypothetical protein
MVTHVSFHSEPKQSGGCDIACQFAPTGWAMMSGWDIQARAHARAAAARFGRFGHVQFGLLIG